MTEYTKIDEYEALQSYEDMLDECYEPIDICGLTYDPSVALKRVDPTAYRCGFLDYCDSMEWEIE